MTRRRVVLAAFVVLTWLFGGLPGLVVGLVLCAIAVLGAPVAAHWAIGLVSIGIAAGSILVQGLPSGRATPAYAGTQSGSHLMAGVGLASIALAILRESIGKRAAADPESGSGRRRGP